MVLCLASYGGHGGSDQHDRIAMARDDGVVSHLAHGFDPGLGNENPVEWILVVGWACFSLNRMFGVDGQESVV